MRNKTDCRFTEVWRRLDQSRVERLVELYSNTRLINALVKLAYHDDILTRVSKEKLITAEIVSDILYDGTPGVVTPERRESYLVALQAFLLCAPENIQDQMNWLAEEMI